MRWSGREKEGKDVEGKVMGERRKARGEGGITGGEVAAERRGRMGGSSWLGLKVYKGCPKKHGNSVTNSISFLL